MKKLLFAAICLAGVLAAQAQGTVNFFNLGSPLVGPAAGDEIILWAGPAGGAIAPVGTSTVAGAGFVTPTVVTVDSVAPGAAADLAVQWGDMVGAPTWTGVALGGVGSPPSAPAGLPAIGDITFEVIPEPSTIALGLLGLGLLFIRRRK